MTQELTTLAITALVAVLCPITANIIPKKPIPETVLLLVAGMVLGPYVLGVLDTSLDFMKMLSNLGMGFLFLLAGYEIDPKTLFGHEGKRGIIVWVISFGLALAVVFLIPAMQDMVTGGEGMLAMALMLTTTALGTLMPILKERGLMGTKIGDSVLAYGTWGELGPVFAMAVLLSTKSHWLSAIILLAFFVICVVIAAIGANAKKAGTRLYKFMKSKENSTSQTLIRVVVLLLTGLLAISSMFDIDLVLGAFAAGFILRYVIPEGNESMEQKLDGMAYGFFIPLFFTVSGAAINPMAIAKMPWLMVAFIALLIAIRCTPIYISMSRDSQTRTMSTRNRMSVALYCTTALPLIVAISSLCVENGFISSDIASVLVGSGAVTVFLMPLLASVSYKVAETKPIDAIKEISHSPSDYRRILHDHVALERAIAQAIDKNQNVNYSELFGKLIPDIAKSVSEMPRSSEESKAIHDEILRRRAWLREQFEAEMKRRLADERQRADRRANLMSEYFLGHPYGEASDDEPHTDNDSPNSTEG